MKTCIFCGQEAIYQLKNKSWCCSLSKNSCPEMRRRNGNGNRNKKRTEDFRKKMSNLMSGSKNHMYGTKGFWIGKKRSNEDINKFRLSHQLNIDQIRKKYLFFSQIEEMRYNPDKPEYKEIQVHCKNHNCQNSKEQEGWFTPTRNQLFERIRQIEHNDGNDGSYFYCSEKCKQTCDLYGRKWFKFLNIEKKLYTDEEYQTLRNVVLERDNYICQFCGEKATDVHHEKPQKLEPFFSLDPDYAWSCCEECHYKKGHRDECSTGNLANKIC